LNSVLCASNILPIQYCSETKALILWIAPMTTISSAPTLPQLQKTPEPRRISWGLLAGYPILLAAVWISRARKRRELAELEDYQLADAGIDPDFVRSEIRKPFWRA
jgi:uncharacterized protein YjiS (DUF1127 family)